MSGSHHPFKPSFGGKVLVVGCSDKSTRGNLLREGQPSGPKLTTYARASAALEEYWQQRAAAGKQPTGANLPGGEAALAHKTRQACWQDSVHLEQQPGRYMPPQANIADIEDKETIRTRGIPGFTGKQPPPHLHRPPVVAPDTSSWVAINAFDERRPRVKGIPGYTGHQPPSPVKQRPGQEAATSGQQAQNTAQVWPAPAASGHTQHTDGSSSAYHYSSNNELHHLCSSHAAEPGSAAVAGAGGMFRSIHSAAEQHQQCSRGHALQQQQQQQHSPATAEHYRPWSAMNASEACSTPYSPRFFINGVEVPPERVQLPSSSPAGNAPAAAAAHHNDHVSPAVGTAAAAHCPGSSFPGQVYAAGHGNSCYDTAGHSLNHAIAAETFSSERPSTCAGLQAAAAQRNAWSAHNAAAASSSAQLQSSTGTWQGPRRSRATTYAASYTPVAGFGLYKQSLQLAGNVRPAPATFGGATC